MTGIYFIKSKSKPRIYVGSAVNISRRFYQHKYQLRRGLHNNVKLQRHYNKYGEDDLVFEVQVMGVRKEDLIQIEQMFMDKIKPYFNLSRRAGRPDVFFSDEMRLKISQAKGGYRRVGLNFPFYHEEHGERFCTMYDLMKEFTLDKQSMYYLTAGIYSNHRGWGIRMCQKDLIEQKTRLRCVPNLNYYEKSISKL